MILLVLGVRCTVSPDLFPGWSGDPLVVESPITGITPAFSLGLDLITLLASAAVLAGCAARGWRPRGWELVVYALGVAAAAWYSVRADSTLSNIVLGCQWLAAFGAGVACVQACRDAAARRLVVAGLVGIALTVALKGGYQVFIEHPQVYRDFLRNKPQILAAQGWSEGSPMALAYERRVSQADAAGWFGLSNVFATVMAAAMTMVLGLLLGGRGGIGRGVSAALLGAGVLLGAAVWLSHSKGGIAAALMGLGLVAAWWVWVRMGWRVPGRVLGVVCAALPFAAIVAVVVRGLIGERMGELSILFRWFYLEGAARVVAESPLLGVGPDGFKEAYLRLKPALSPEEVSSPHSWYVDLIATLGVGGWAWACWIVVRLWRVGTGVAVSGNAGHGPKSGRGTQREDVRWLLVLFGLVTAASALFEHRIASVEGTLLRLVSLVGAVAVGGVVVLGLRWGEDGRHGDEGGRHSDGDVAMARKSAVAPLVAAVVAAVTHCQIEMTGITAGAGMWVVLLLAACAGAGLAADPARLGSNWTIRGRAGAALMVVVAAVPAVALATVVPWELRVREATRIVEPVPVFAERAGALAGGRAFPGDSTDRLSRDLSVALGQAVAPSGIAGAIDRLRLGAVVGAAGELERALGAGVRDFQTTRALSRLMLLAALANPNQVEVLKGAEAAERVIHAHMDATGTSSSGWAWIGTMRRTVWARTRGEREGRRAVEAFARASELSPFEPVYRVEAARLEAAMGDMGAAAGWAAEALRLNENLRLDPVRQLAGRDLEEVRRLAGG